MPDLGLDVPVTPHLTLEINEYGGNGRKESFLRFDKVVLNLPLTGPVDVASLLPPLSLLPDAGLDREQRARQGARPPDPDRRQDRSEEHPAHLRLRVDPAPDR